MKNGRQECRSWGAVSEENSGQQEISGAGGPWYNVKGEKNSPGLASDGPFVRKKEVAVVLQPKVKTQLCSKP